MTPHCTGGGIDIGYYQALAALMSDDSDDHVTVEVTEPIVTTVEDLPASTSVSDWEDILNLGDIYEAFLMFPLGKVDPKSGGQYGRDWLDGRLQVMFEGKYQDRLTEPHDQLEKIIDRLQAGMHGSSTNALVGQVFDRDNDLQQATIERPNARGIPCLTQIQFRPHDDVLDLFATFRSQWWDLKALGNLVALSALLADICSRTGYRPGKLVSRCNNVVLENRDRARALKVTLSESQYGRPHP